MRDIYYLKLTGIHGIYGLLSGNGTVFTKNRTVFTKYNTTIRFAVGREEVEKVQTITALEIF